VGRGAYIGYFRSWAALVPAFTVAVLEVVAVEGSAGAHLLAAWGYARDTGGLTRTDFGILFRLRDGRADYGEFHGAGAREQLAARVAELA
jgi:hypothetical protein